MERLDAFMARANAAYYATQDFWTDFATAPEISQAFGELLGAWAAVVWQAMGAPEPVLLAEAGPGRGTLMADALRAIHAVAPAFGRALRLHFVEASPRLRAVLVDRFPQAQLHDDVASLPDGPLLLLANEFLDALPVRQFIHTLQGWSERYVAEGAFVAVPCLPPDHADTEAEIVELSPQAEALVRDLARRFRGSTGVALFVDYGPEAYQTGDSLQALHRGRPGDLLLAPGNADLSAHVPFARLAETARAAGARVFGPVAQAAFLTALGLFPRLDRLARGKPPAMAAALRQGGERLVAPDAMGRLFKVFAIASPGLPAPPGFPA